MAVKYIRQCDLPAKPFVDFGDEAKVERPAQDADIIGRSAGERDIDLTEARVEEEGLREDAVFPELVGEIIAHGQSGRAIGVVVKNRDRGRWRRRIGFGLHQVREAFMRVVNAGKQIKSGVGSLDGVEANASSENVAEIEILQGVVEEVGTAESKRAGSEVAVVTESAAVRVRRGLRGRYGLERGLAGGGVNRGFVKNQLVVE